jgi:hypothetical protein
MGAERENAAPALADSALGKGFVSWFRQKCKVRVSVERLILLTYTLIPDLVGCRYHAPGEREKVTNPFHDFEYFHLTFTFKQR